MILYLNSRLHSAAHGIVALASSSSLGTNKFVRYVIFFLPNEILPLLKFNFILYAFIARVEMELSKFGILMILVYPGMSLYLLIQFYEYGPVWIDLFFSL